MNARVLQKCLDEQIHLHQYATLHMDIEVEEMKIFFNHIHEQIINLKKLLGCVDISHWQPQKRTNHSDYRDIIAL